MFMYRHSLSFDWWNLIDSLIIGAACNFKGFAFTLKIK